VHGWAGDSAACSRSLISHELFAPGEESGRADGAGGWDLKKMDLGGLLERPAMRCLYGPIMSCWGQSWKGKVWGLGRYVKTKTPIDAGTRQVGWVCGIWPI